MPDDPADMADLPPGWTLVEYVMVGKCLDDDAHERLTVFTSDGLSTWESAGMMIAAADAYRRDITAAMEDE